MTGSASAGDGPAELVAPEPHRMQVNDGWGEEIGGGIYMINRKVSQKLPEGMMTRKDPPVLLTEIKRLYGVMQRLAESNAELSEALAEDPDEAVYSESITENEASMELHRGRIAELESELRALGCNCMVEKLQADVAQAARGQTDAAADEDDGGLTL
eukprot:TRINITY_DN33952_c0_g1_i1.p1 TRINITY_DN33952_c0_g1~~TRINITY_DN33952_c0_g1_i1.p1  ORF type:complete len:157 (+),score=36.63 TRINITY_DN33952_c0_g1_i1:73-543(+)